MKQSKQNKLIFFFPLIDIGGVEKNFFIISKYLVKKLTNFNHYIVTFKKTNSPKNRCLHINLVYHLQLGTVKVHLLIVLSKVEL